jgi:hypothetical protein
MYLQLVRKSSKFAFAPEIGCAGSVEEIWSLVSSREGGVLVHCDLGVKRSAIFLAVSSLKDKARRGTDEQQVCTILSLCIDTVRLCVGGCQFY